MATLKAANIKPGTTPLLTAVVDGEAIQTATIYVTINMGDRQLTKSNYNGNDAVMAEAIYDSYRQQTGTQVYVQFSQADTLCLRPGNARLEIGWIFEDGTADKADIGRIEITDTLYRGVMAYGGHSS